MVKPENQMADKPYLVIFLRIISTKKSFWHEVDPKTAEDDDSDPE